MKRPRVIAIALMVGMLVGSGCSAEPPVPGASPNPTRPSPTPTPSPEPVDPWADRSLKEIRQEFRDRKAISWLMRAANPDRAELTERGTWYAAAPGWSMRQESIAKHGTKTYRETSLGERLWIQSERDAPTHCWSQAPDWYVEDVYGPDTTPTPIWLNLAWGMREKDGVITTPLWWGYQLLAPRVTRTITWQDPGSLVAVAYRPRGQALSVPAVLAAGRFDELRRVVVHPGVEDGRLVSLRIEGSDIVRGLRRAGGSLPLRWILVLNRLTWRVSYLDGPHLEKLFVPPGDRVQAWGETTCTEAD